ncbi:MAG: hypothetical protein ACRDY1_10575, partial [Acidimicrobiales bacterium]
GVTRYPPGLRDGLALMSDGPVPSPTSALGGRPAARVTRWLWTVALPDEAGRRRPDGDSAGDPAGDPEGDLDHADVRIAALDEW